ncbi:MAG: aspartate kinase [Saprospiraceae bacterium]
MKILKFGGTSVGSAERMCAVADLIHDDEPKIVVLSAVSGTTNKLVALSASLLQGKVAQAEQQLAALEEEYKALVKQLLPSAFYQRRAEMVLTEIWDEIRPLLGKEFIPQYEKIILAQGELISTQLFQLYLESQSIPSRLLPALDFMRTDEQGDPDLSYILEELEHLLSDRTGVPYFITQGYICRNSNGEIDNLQRGGSDYTATLIGAVLKAEEIQIWTDIDGIHNNDPRIVKNTFPLRRVSYREAAELAYFGAKILHPTCVIPAEESDVPIRLKNTFEPDAPGTLISSEGSGRRIAAIAAKDGITAIKIRSGRMLNAYGFLRQVFNIFEQFHTPIDMITTSEVSVSLTIDNNTYLDAIVGALEPFGEVSYETDQSIICIVGDRLHQQTGFTRDIFDALEDVPLRMVSYGGSNNNLSILIGSSYKELALRSLNAQLFNQRLPHGEHV